MARARLPPFFVALSVFKLRIIRVNGIRLFRQSKQDNGPLWNLIIGPARKRRRRTKLVHVDKAVRCGQIPVRVVRI